MPNNNREIQFGNGPLSSDASTLQELARLDAMDQELRQENELKKRILEAQTLQQLAAVQITLEQDQHLSNSTTKNISREIGRRLNQLFDESVHQARQEANKA